MPNHKQIKSPRGASVVKTKAKARQQSSGVRRPGRSEERRRAVMRSSAANRSPHRRRVWFLATGVVVLGGLGGALAAVAGSSGRVPVRQHTDVSRTAFSGPPGPEGVPVETGSPLAPQTTNARGTSVNGIRCDTSEQVVYHIHTHLSIYVNGVLRPVPAGVGIVSPVAEQTANGPFDGATQCYYWLHVHAQDGVIHIESPSVRTYTLGDLFAIWGQPLGTNEVGPATGVLTVFVHGRPYHRDPSNITLGSHEDIQIDLGTPIVPPKRIDWSVTGL